MGSGRIAWKHNHASPRNPESGHRYTKSAPLPRPAPGFGPPLRTAVPADCSGEVDFSDFLAYFNCYDTLQPCADIDGSTEVDMADFCDFFNAFDQGC